MAWAHRPTHLTRTTAKIPKKQLQSSTQAQVQMTRTTSWLANDLTVSSRLSDRGTKQSLTPLAEQRAAPRKGKGRSRPKKVAVLLVFVLLFICYFSFDMWWPAVCSPWLRARHQPCACRCWSAAAPLAAFLKEECRCALLLAFFSRAGFFLFGGFSVPVPGCSMTWTCQTCRPTTSALAALVESSSSSTIVGPAGSVSWSTRRRGFTAG